MHSIEHLFDKDLFHKIHLMIRWPGDHQAAPTSLRNVPIPRETWDGTLPVSQAARQKKLLPSIDVSVARAYIRTKPWWMSRGASLINVSVANFASRRYKLSVITSSSTSSLPPFFHHFSDNNGLTDLPFEYLPVYIIL